MEKGEHSYKPPEPMGTGNREEPERSLQTEVEKDPFGIETMLHEGIARQQRYAQEKGWTFNPSKFVYRRLLQMAVDAIPSRFHEVEVPEETSDLFKKMATSLGILAYPQWEPKDQKNFRRSLQRIGGAVLCDEADLDWDRETIHDHTITLPEPARQLLKRITNVTGVPYNPEQGTFRFSTVLNHPEPIVQEKGSTEAHS